MPDTSEQASAAQKRKAAADGKPDVARGYIEALLAERRGYVTRGLDDRVSQVDAELERLGHEVEKPRRGRARTGDESAD